MGILQTQTTEELQSIERKQRERIKGIEDGTQPATPDSLPNARQLLARVLIELGNRGVKPTPLD